MQRATSATTGACMVLPPLALPTAADEISHRVANHLQLISALVSIEGRAIADPAARAVLERTQSRIAAVGAVHRQLYSAGPGGIDLGRYLLDLGEQLAGSCGANRRILVDIESVEVESATAISVGILVTELVTNACKHGYAADQTGDVHVRLRALADGRYRLIVEDQGRGGAISSADGGLGTRLIEMTAAKLGGVVAWENADPGTRFRMDFLL